jgi:ribosomal protein L37AE/L43A
MSELLQLVSKDGLKRKVFARHADWRFFFACPVCDSFIGVVEEAAVFSCPCCGENFSISLMGQEGK